MAILHRSPLLPDNIVEWRAGDPRDPHRLYEAGNLLVLPGLRVTADFAFLEAMRVTGEENRRKKFHLTHPRHYTRERVRNIEWRDIRHRAFPRGLRGTLQYRHFRAQVLAVHDQIVAIARLVLPRYRTLSEPILWKFQHVRGENLHIDNIDECDRWARLRVFVNLGTSDRIWAIGGHLRTYAAEHFTAAGLEQYADDPFTFNQRLSHVAFGDSRRAANCNDPRHLVYFEPGEVWLLNSMVTAHQVLYGTRAAVATFPFAYDDFLCPEEALPRLVRSLCRARAASG